MFVKPKLPNLLPILLEAQKTMYKSEAFTNVMHDVQEDERNFFPDYEIDCFPQVWSSSLCGFDVDADGNTLVGMSTLTKEYTTIVHELMTETYVVFFGDRKAYMVIDPGEEFINDIDARKMASVRVAMEKY